MRFSYTTVLCLLVLCFAVSACSTLGSTPEERAESRHTIVTTGHAFIENLNAAGVDPLKLKPNQQAIAIAVCTAAPSITTVVRPGAPEASDAVLKYCGLVLKALADAGTPVPASPVADRSAEPAA
ncbi:MAG: hypothetical protein AAF674_22575 [Pseudomonadota bacterium]